MSSVNEIERIKRAVKVTFRMQQRLKGKVTLHCVGDTWEGEHTIGIEVPLGLYEGVSPDTASELETLLRDFRDRLVALLDPGNADSRAADDPDGPASDSGDPGSPRGA